MKKLMLIACALFFAMPLFAQQFKVTSLDDKQRVCITAFLDPESPAYHSYGAILKEGGLLDVLYIGVKAGVYPCLIFIGVG